MAGKAKGAQTTHTAERWQQILRLMDEVFEDYLAELPALRERVVADLERKLSDSDVLVGPATRAAATGARDASDSPRARGR